VQAGDLEQVAGQSDMIGLDFLGHSGGIGQTAQKHVEADYREEKAEQEAQR